MGRHESVKAYFLVLILNIVTCAKVKLLQCKLALSTHLNAKFKTKNIKMNTSVERLQKTMEDLQVLITE